MDSAWYQKVKARVAHMPGIDLRYVAIEHPENEATRPHYEPVPSYVSVAEAFDAASLDFILVDGHYRQACVLAGLPKLRPGGLLVIDDTDWLPDAEWAFPRIGNEYTVARMWSP